MKTKHDLPLSSINPDSELGKLINPSQKESSNNSTRAWIVWASGIFTQMLGASVVNERSESTKDLFCRSITKGALQGAGRSLEKQSHAQDQYLTMECLVKAAILGSGSGIFKEVLEELFNNNLRLVQKKEGQLSDIDIAIYRASSSAIISFLGQIIDHPLNLLNANNEQEYAKIKEEFRIFTIAKNTAIAFGVGGATSFAATSMTPSILKALEIDPNGKNVDAIATAIAKALGLSDRANTAIREAITGGAAGGINSAVASTVSNIQPLSEAMIALTGELFEKIKAHPSSYKTLEARNEKEANGLSSLYSILISTLSGAISSSIRSAQLSLKAHNDFERSREVICEELQKLMGSRYRSERKKALKLFDQLVEIPDTINKITLELKSQEKLLQDLEDTIELIDLLAGKMGKYYTQPTYGDALARITDKYNIDFWRSNRDELLRSLGREVLVAHEISQGSHDVNKEQPILAALTECVIKKFINLFDLSAQLKINDHYIRPSDQAYSNLPAVRKERILVGLFQGKLFYADDFDQDVDLDLDFYNRFQSLIHEVERLGKFYAQGTEKKKGYDTFCRALKSSKIYGELKAHFKEASKRNQTAIREIANKLTQTRQKRDEEFDRTQDARSDLNNKLKQALKKLENQKKRAQEVFTYLLENKYHADSIKTDLEPSHTEWFWGCLTKGQSMSFSRDFDTEMRRPLSININEKGEINFSENTLDLPKKLISLSQALVDRLENETISLHRDLGNLNTQIRDLEFEYQNYNENIVIQVPPTLQKEIPELAFLSFDYKEHYVKLHDVLDSFLEKSLQVSIDHAYDPLVNLGDIFNAFQKEVKDLIQEGIDKSMPGSQVQIDYLAMLEGFNQNVATAKTAYLEHVKTNVSLLMPDGFDLKSLHDQKTKQNQKIKDITDELASIAKELDDLQSPDNCHSRQYFRGLINEGFSWADGIVIDESHWEKFVNNLKNGVRMSFSNNIYFKNITKKGYSQFNGVHYYLYRKESIDNMSEQSSHKMRIAVLNQKLVDARQQINEVDGAISETLGSRVEMFKHGSLTLPKPSPDILGIIHYQTNKPSWVN